MAFTIRTLDGCTTICTATAEAAVTHLERLQQAGSMVEVYDVNGAAYEVSGLHHAADGLRAARAAIVHTG